MDVDAAPLDINPYTVLSVAVTATASEIRTAYRKLALILHPDKVPYSEREAAHVKFQELAFAYAVLSDESRRKRYDATGSLKESSIDADINWAEFYREQFKDVVSVEAVEKFRLEYQGSEEEKADLLECYTEAKGDMDIIFSTIMLSDPLTDEARFRDILDAAIAAGEIDGFPAYLKETKASKKKRFDKAKKEAKEAEKYAKKLGVHDKLFGAKDKEGEGSKKEGDIALESLIKSRNANRMDEVIANIEAKYGGGGKRGEKRGGKRSKVVDEDVPPEPTDEEFEAAHKRLKRGMTEKEKQAPKAPRRSARTRK